MNYGRRFVTLYRRQESRPSPRKRNAKKQNGCLRRPFSIWPHSIYLDSLDLTFQVPMQYEWTWTWANSERWWGVGRPGELPSMGLQRVGHHLVTEPQWWQGILWFKLLILQKRETEAHRRQVVWLGSLQLWQCWKPLLVSFHYMLLPWICKLIACVSPPGLSHSWTRTRSFLTFVFSTSLSTM